jgi:hypothetical protein
MMCHPRQWFEIRCVAMHSKNSTWWGAAPSQATATDQSSRNGSHSPKNSNLYLKWMPILHTLIADSYRWRERKKDTYVSWVSLGRNSFFEAQFSIDVLAQSMDSRRGMANNISAELVGKNALESQTPATSPGRHTTTMLLTTLAHSLCLSRVP